MGCKGVNLNRESDGQRIPNPQDGGQRQPASENGSSNGAGRGPVSGAERVTGSGAATSGSWEQRRRGPRAAKRLAQRLRADRDLSPAQRLRLEHVCLLAVHLHNLSLRLFRDGETRTDGESKAALAKLLELEKAVRDGLSSIFGDAEPGDHSDPLSALLGGSR
jgi:hypothetical protein